MSVHTWLLGGAADGERVPLVLGNHWDVDVDVISRFKLEELGTPDHQVSHLVNSGTESRLDTGKFKKRCVQTLSV